VTVGTTGPIGSGLPQFGFPRRFAMKHCPRSFFEDSYLVFSNKPNYLDLSAALPDSS
jgi:hypothetical protein